MTFYLINVTGRPAAFPPKQTSVMQQGACHVIVYDVHAFGDLVSKASHRRLLLMLLNAESGRYLLHLNYTVNLN